MILVKLNFYFTKKKSTKILELIKVENDSNIEWICDLENGKMLGISYISGCIIGTLSLKKTKKYSDIYKKGIPVFCVPFYDDFKCQPIIKDFLKSRNYVFIK